MKFKLFLTTFLIIGIKINLVFGLYRHDMYYNTHGPSETLVRGDDESVMFKLNQPVHFYSEKYDSVYINTNGILTFKHEFSSFLNIQFPLDYPAISVFYSNVDTTTDNDSAKVLYFQSNDDHMLDKASEYVRRAFSDAIDFQASAIVVVTWENVGYFDRKDDLQNTFQVAIISNDEESFVQFLYPEGGINWIQAETGDSGLSDIRARVGFNSEDGRYYLVKESASESIRHVTDASNVDVPGVWLFRVGPLKHGESENIEEPDVTSSSEDNAEPLSCSNKGRFKCHSSAFCQDESRGFCCVCKTGFYGNGYNCIKNSVPIRVSGTVTGEISGQTIDTRLQSYISMGDGRTYTAITPIDKHMGNQLLAIPVIGTSIGWLFAKPMSNDNSNGYQITGGKFDHVSTIRFENSNQMLYITQKFNGLDPWDQLTVDVSIQGEVPHIPEDVGVYLNDYTEQYTSGSLNTLQSQSSLTMELADGSPPIKMSVYQNISFESCEYMDHSKRDNFVGNARVAKISIVYTERENALRFGMVTKVGVPEKSDPCSDGSANCGENTICVATDDDNYECTCINGYTYDEYSRDREVVSCVDIDECSSRNLCSEFAECQNTAGGYSCRCYPGYYGNGYECNVISSGQDTTPPHYRPHYPQETTPYYRPHYETTPYYRPNYEHTTDYAPPRYHSPCERCVDNAVCIEESCFCKEGFYGDGYRECTSVCKPNQAFRDNECVDSESPEVDDYEIDPICSLLGCHCPRGYELVDMKTTYICRWMDQDDPVTDEAETMSCDIVNNCHRNGACEYNYDSQKYECICNSGFEGNGYECMERDRSCSNENICDPHATCVYNENYRKSVCICDQGYEGDGYSCQLSAECQSDNDCGLNSVCDDRFCMCRSGYERDISDNCVLAGSCGGAYCAENAQCKFDDRQKVSYCFCPPGFQGDGVHECKSMPPPCNVRNNCGLYASCVPNYRNPRIYECVCDPGYYGDGFVCTPERNCNNIPTLCHIDAECMSTTSGWQCICKQGFMGNGSHCKKPPKLEDGFLIVSQGVAAVKIPLDGGRGVPVSASSMAIAVDKDCGEGRVYWSDISSKAIFSSEYSGADRKVFVDKDIISPEGLAIDWSSRRIYWTDSGKDTIEVASLDNSTQRTVLANKGLVNPRGIAVDPRNGKIYWSDWNREAPKIEQSNLDGTDRKVLLASPQVRLPNSLAISLTSGELCFADAGNQKIDCIDTYTNAVRTAADNLSYPFGLALTNDHYYWSDWTTKKIESVDHHGVRKSGMQTPLFSSHKMYGMTAVTDVCPFYYSPCALNNGDCAADRICLPSNSSPSRKSCKCITSSACSENLSEV